MPGSLPAQHATPVDHSSARPAARAGSGDMVGRALSGAGANQDARRMGIERSRPWGGMLASSDYPRPATAAVHRRPGTGRAKVRPEAPAVPDVTNSGHGNAVTDTVRPGSIRPPAPGLWFHTDASSPPNTAVTLSFRPSVANSCAACRTVPSVRSGTGTELDGTRKMPASVGSTLAPGPGSVRRMSPASMSASNAGSPTVTVKPASCKDFRASSVGRPRTSGTVSAFETRTDTADPRGASTPAAGSVDSTTPASALGSNASARAPMAKPAAARRVSASWADLPTTSGTWTGAGPADSTRVTGLSTVSDVPAAGSVRTTAPTGTLSSNTGFGPRTALRSAAVSAASAVSGPVPGAIEGTAGWA